MRDLKLRKTRVHAMTRGKPFLLDPERDLKGATPETLAKALLRNRLLPNGVGKPVVGDEAAPEEPLADEEGDSVPHLKKGV